MPEYQPIFDAVGGILAGLTPVDPLDSTATLAAEGGYRAPGVDLGHVFERNTWDVGFAPDATTSYEDHAGVYVETVQVAMTLYLGPQAEEGETLEAYAVAWLGAAVDALKSGAHYGLGGLVDTQQVVTYAPGIGVLPNGGDDWIALSLGLTVTRAINALC